MTVVFLFHWATLECLVSATKSHGRFSNASRSYFRCDFFPHDYCFAELLADFNILICRFKY